MKNKKKTNFKKENKQKSINGRNLEIYIMDNTGLKKATLKNLYWLINQHGSFEEIDADFIVVLKNNKNEDVIVFIDATTTYRKARGRQKADNGLLLKMYAKFDYKYYIAVKSLKEKNKIIKAYPLHGVDGIFEVDDIITMIMSGNVDSLIYKPIIKKIPKSVDLSKRLN